MTAERECRADIAVIGGGIHGCAASLELAERGHRVILLERDRIGAHASGVNAGGVRVLARALPEIPLADAAVGLWHGLAERLGAPCHFRVSGHVQVAETKEDVESQERRLAALARAGLSTEYPITAARLRRTLPGVASHCYGAVASAGDGNADPAATMLAYRGALKASGVRIIEGEGVLALEKSGGGWSLVLERHTVRADVVVNCAGAWGGELARFMGDEVPVEAVAPMMLVTQRVRRFLDPVVIGCGRPLSAKQSRNGTILIGGGRLGRVDRTSRRTEVDLAELRYAARTFSEIFPESPALLAVRAWAGIEGRTPDGLPVIGRGNFAGNVVHAFGFSLHGFALGPVVGRLVADLVCDGQSTFDLAAFRPDRFAPGHSNGVNAGSGREESRSTTQTG